MSDTEDGGVDQKWLIHKFKCSNCGAVTLADRIVGCFRCGLEMDPMGQVAEIEFSDGTLQNGGSDGSEVMYKCKKCETEVRKSRLEDHAHTEHDCLRGTGMQLFKKVNPNAE